MGGLGGAGVEVEEMSARKCCCMKKGGKRRCDEQVSVHKESTGAALARTTDTHADSIPGAAAGASM